MNEYTIRQWYDIFKDNKELVEIRILDPNAKKSYSGYFTDIETILGAIRPYDNCNIYFTLNVINDACYSREQHNRISTRPKSTTSDKEIIARKWCLIDIDCEKPADTNSSDAEKELAKQVVNNVYKFLRDEGFEQPVICDSANGYHLLYKQAMVSTDENTEKMKDFLKVLDMYFSTDKVKIDCSTFNPSRICKLYGVISRKGANTVERPQRESAILRVPNEVKVTANEYFEKVAGYLPKPETRDRSNNYGAATSSFNLDEFLNQHNIGVRNVVTTTEYTKYVLEHCCFNTSHTAPDAAVFKMKDGSFGFRCLHQSCQQYTFRDFRKFYDPTAYDRETSYPREQYRPAHFYKQEPYKPIEETEEKGKVWLKMSEIKKPLFSFADFIPSGIAELDRRGIGFKRGMVSVWTGKRGCGKSSLLNMLILNAAQKGFKSALWTGELTDSMAKSWIYLQAAGKAYNERQFGTDYYVTPDNIAARIDPWIDKYFWLFNNKYGDNFKQIEEQVRKLVKEQGIDVVIMDNLMTLDIRMLDENKYDRQAILLQSLEDLAKELNIHIHLVAHPHKSLAYIQVDNISGSGDISNKADNIFVLSRVDTAFKTNAKEYMSAFDYQSIIDSGCTNVIEVGKFRSKGTLMGAFFKLWFEEESNRLKNDIAESIVYGWAEPPHQETLSYHDSQPYVAPKYEPKTPNNDDGFVPPVAGCPF